MENSCQLNQNWNIFLALGQVGFIFICFKIKIFQATVCLTIEINLKSLSYFDDFHSHSFFSNILYHQFVLAYFLMLFFQLHFSQKIRHSFFLFKILQFNYLIVSPVNLCCFFSCFFFGYLICFFLMMFFQLHSKKVGSPFFLFNILQCNDFIVSLVNLCC